MAVLHQDAPVVTVFGGTGFLGKYVVLRLAKKGFIVRIPTRNPNRVLPLRVNGPVGQIVAAPTNIHSQASVEKAIAGSDYVINLIGIPFEKGKRQTFKKAHVDFPAMLGAIAASSNVQQIVHVSALGADPLAPSLYSSTKGVGEVVLRQTFPKTVIVRPGILFGDEDSFINKFARMARFLPFLPLIGGGRTLFQPVYVGDVADAIVRVLTDAHAARKTYSLAGPRIYSFEDILNYIMYITGQKRFLFPVPFEVMSVLGSILEKSPFPFSGPLLTRDQVKLLKVDNLLPEDAEGFEKLDIAPSSLEVIAPRYLSRYRAGGRFAVTKTV